jgi:hypothetical protein
LLLGGKFKLFSQDIALWSSGRKTGMGSKTRKLKIVTMYCKH